MNQDEPARTKSLASLIQRAGCALDAGNWFEAERLAEEALQAGRTREDWVGMGEIIDIIQAARLGRRDPSLVKGPVSVFDEPYEEGAVLEPGRWLLQPPLVGADARRLRIASLEADVPVLILCREPTTRAGLVPLVAIAPGSTIRTQVKLPANEKKPTATWFQSSLNALGQAAIDAVDPGLVVDRRIDALLGALDAVPDHDGLHDALLQACNEAANQGD